MKVKEKLRDYAALDKSVRWQYKSDWLKVAHASGYQYISEWLFREAEKGATQAQLARAVGVHPEAIYYKFKRFGIPSQGPGGRNNTMNKSGIFRYKPVGKNQIFSFVAGEVEIHKTYCEYYRLRCTHCNKTLSNVWLRHKEIYSLIRQHVKEGCDETSD